LAAGWRDEMPLGSANFSLMGSSMDDVDHGYAASNA
jgi:hypothetical protein